MRVLCVRPKIGACREKLDDLEVEAVAGLMGGDTAEERPAEEGEVPGDV